MTYEERSAFACDICGNVPDDTGDLEHGRGCYVLSEDGGGSTFVPEIAQAAMLARPWSYICNVDQAALDCLRAWLKTVAFPDPSHEDKPSRIHEPPASLVRPIMYLVLREFDGVADVADSVMISRMLPGQNHGMHFDHLHHDCLTRVHVPIVTNPGCWMEFEDERETCEANLSRHDLTKVMAAPWPMLDGNRNQIGVVKAAKYDGTYTVGTIEKFARVHFEAGKAYTFDARRRHAFGNDGETARVHLIFDVLRAKP